MRNFYYFFLLFLLFISGCTQEEGSSTQVIINPEKGLIITNLTSNFNTLRINQATDIKALFYNNGDFEARDINSIFYGEGLLKRVSIINHTNSLLPGKQDFHFLTLKVPTVLSQSESTNYFISSKVFYYYNFSTSQQVGFVPPSYTGSDLPLSTIKKESPLIASVEAKNPIRTLETINNTLFLATITVTNKGLGDVDYINCSPLKEKNPCLKGNHLNTLLITVPSAWIPASSLKDYVDNNAIEVITNEDDESITYLWSYDKLNNAYELNCKGDSTAPNCTFISQAISDLNLIRGEEARIVLQFYHPQISETVIDNVLVTGDFGYEFDARDFDRPINLLILGD